MLQGYGRGNASSGIEGFVESKKRVAIWVVSWPPSVRMRVAKSGWWQWKQSGFNRCFEPCEIDEVGFSKLYIFSRLRHLGRKRIELHQGVTCVGATKCSVFQSRVQHARGPPTSWIWDRVNKWVNLSSQSIGQATIVRRALQLRQTLQPKNRAAIPSKYKSHCEDLRQN